MRNKGIKIWALDPFAKIFKVNELIKEDLKLKT